MMHKAILDQADITSIIAERFGVNPRDVRIDHRAEQNDGPHHTPASITAEVSSSKPLRPTPGGGQ